MDSFWDFQRETNKRKGVTVKAYMAGEGRQRWKEGDMFMFMFKEKSGRRKKQTNQPKQQNETKPKSEEKRVSYNSYQKSKRNTLNAQTGGE